VPRKRQQNRRKVASNVVTLRLDEDEREGLDALVRQQNVKLRKMRMPAVVTRASYLRSLVHRELESLGMRPAASDEPLEPVSLVLVPPRKRLRRTIKKMPGKMTVDRVVAPKAPAPEPEQGPRMTVWERLRTNLFEEKDSKE
jgi:hypothetical protein